LLKEKKDIDLDISKIPLNDTETYKFALELGNTYRVIFHTMKARGTRNVCS
jgi:DNA polymerase III, alpha subunit